MINYLITSIKYEYLCRHFWLFILIYTNNIKEKKNAGCRVTCKKIKYGSCI